MQLVAMLIQFSGVIFFGFVISSLASVLQSGSRAARRASAFRQKYEGVRFADGPLFMSYALRSVARMK